uniref:NEDD4-like E3 ubiquitin-protein ligase WWP2 n=1 Tax=Pan troglodytes TaxID=9598 RepID=G2HHJ4_PANTR|nr:NEDD4-like E3 ubiquitin-protein ligase WWP2 [Pan troglodytes]
MRGVEVPSATPSLAAFNREEIPLLDRVPQAVPSGGTQGSGCGAPLPAPGAPGGPVGPLFRMECSPPAESVHSA